MILIVRLALVSVLLTGLSAAQTFSAPLTYDTTIPPLGAVYADVNHDGFLDVLVASSGAISVMLNDGTGALHQVAVYQVVDALGGIAVGDFNGDGVLDIAVASEFSGVIVLLGNGDGTFQSPKTYAVVGSPASIVVGDFNHDGKMDIATLGQDNNTITILTNTGSSFTASSFVAPQYWSATFHSSDMLWHLTAGDFNGDGRIDLAYVDTCLPNGSSYCGPDPSVSPSDNYYVLLNKTTGWEAHPVFPHASSKYIIGTMNLHAVDVDNDGRADLVGTFWDGFPVAYDPTPISVPCHSCPYGVEVLYSNGDGTFAPLNINLEGGTFDPPYDTVVADINNDGINDLVTGFGWGGIGTAGFEVLEGKGGRAGFKAPTKFFKATQPYVIEMGIGAGLFRAQPSKDIIAVLDLDDLEEFRNTTSFSAEPCPYPATPALHYCGPANGSTVTGTDVTFHATARAASGPVSRLELWVDGHKLFQAYSDRMIRVQPLSKGKHAATIVEVDSAGSLIKSRILTFTVK